MVFYKTIYAKTEEKGFHSQQHFPKTLKSCLKGYLHIEFNLNHLTLE